MVLEGYTDLWGYSSLKAPLQRDMTFWTSLEAGGLVRDCSPKAAFEVWSSCGGTAQRDPILGVPGELNNRSILKCLDLKCHLEPGKFFPGKSIMRISVFSGQANFKKSEFPNENVLPGNTPGVCKDSLKNITCPPSPDTLCALQIQSHVSMCGSHRERLRVITSSRRSADGNGKISYS